MMNSTTFEIVQTHVFYVVVEMFVLEMLVIGACFIVSVIVKSYHYFERITFGTR
jgi:hypothetical protein